jgi:hypothetical protein
MQTYMLIGAALSALTGLALLVHWWRTREGPAPRTGELKPPGEPDIRHLVRTLRRGDRRDRNRKRRGAHARQSPGSHRRTA